MISDTELKERLNRAYKKLKKDKRPGGWRAIGEQFHLPSRTAWRIATTDYILKDAHLRHAQGLTTLLPAPACPRCGQVHVTRRCTLNGAKRKTPRRIAIRTDDMVSAAATIYRNLAPEKVLELLQLLEVENENASNREVPR